MRRKPLIILLLLLGISTVHFLTPTGSHGLHLVHIVFGKLFLLPIALASAWFGLPGGFVASVVSATIYLIHINIDWKGQISENLNQLSDLIAFIVVGVGSGLLISISNRLKSERDKEKKRAETDPLTSLFNRNFLETHFAFELLRAKTHGYPLSICIMDIDRFKQINDRWGHQAGDHALVHLAQILEDTKREVDIAVRYGGDEFLVLCPGFDAPQVKSWGHALQQRLSENPVVLEGSSYSHSLSISIGVAQYDPGNDDEENLFRRADDALYESKKKASDGSRTPLN